MTNDNPVYTEAEENFVRSVQRTFNALEAGRPYFDEIDSAEEASRADLTIVVQEHDGEKVEDFFPPLVREAIRRSGRYTDEEFVASMEEAIEAGIAMLKLMEQYVAGASRLADGAIELPPVI